MATYNFTTSSPATKPMVFDLDIDKPPDTLILLINPSEFQLKFTPKVTEHRVRWTSQNIGYIFQAHHDELDTMTASGISAMFIGNEGITRENRIQTLAYENIQHLIAFYRNNGMNINRKPGSKLNPCMIDSVGRVVITYDNFVYRGQFLSLSITENDEKPFNVTFSFDYKISQTLNLGNVIQNNLYSTITQQRNLFS
jgi:hypothetical protein